MNPSLAELDHVFGQGAGTTPEERAASVQREYVRSLDQIALATPAAKGRRLTAREALDAYGIDVLREVADEGSALLAERADAAGRVLRERREQLGLSIDRVAKRARLPPEVMEALEASRRRPLRDYERAARALALDERMLSVRAEPVGNERVAVRLRTLESARGSLLTTAAVLALSDAAWVAMTQARLEDALGLSHDHGFAPSTDYGGRGRPAWRAGFALAQQVRTTLNLGADPIPSVRELAETRLGVPVIQCNLGDDIAGATVEVGSRRAVVLNLVGRNREVYVRRTTLAHELGHILFDPSQRLSDLRVDAYEDFDRDPTVIADVVEQRANAFAVELLAPQAELVRRFRQTPPEGVAALIDAYGMSFTATRYQLWNGLDRAISLDELDAENTPSDPAWEGRERGTLDFHPIRGLTDHPSRAGRFSALVFCAATKSVISWDTAAEWLMSPETAIRGAERGLRDLYSDVFP